MYAYDHEPPPRGPTSALPGSDEKVAVLAERWALRLPLHVPGDARLGDGEAVLAAARLSSGHLNGRHRLARGVKPHKRRFQARPFLPGLGRVYLGEFEDYRAAGLAVEAATRLALLALPPGAKRRGRYQLS
jgi:hypothetical protein